MTPTLRRRIQAVLLAGAIGWPLVVLAQQPSPAAKSEPAKAQPKAQPRDPAKSAAKPKPDPTAAQSEVEAGVAALGQGRNDIAVARLSSAISAGSLPQAQTARALYYRGVAYRRQSKPALAIADLTNALWIKNGLVEEQRADALQQRSAAYRDAGLPEQGPPPSPPAQSAQAAAKAKPGTPPPMFTAVAPQPGSNPSGASSGGSTASFFGSLMGSTNTPAQPASPAVQSADGPKPSGTVERARMPPPSGFESVTNDVPVFYQGPARSAPPVPTTPPPPTAAAKSWDAATEVKGPKAKSVQQAAVQSPSGAAARTGAATTGTVRFQVAAVRSPQEAQGVASKLQAGYARELGGRAPVVEQVALSSGTLYRVQIGPFASPRDAEPLCARLKGDGLECRVLNQ
jgi:hypothetical protein